jgi:hypothetical protein
MTLCSAILVDEQQLKRLRMEFGRHEEGAVNVSDSSVIFNEIASMATELQTRFERARTSCRDNTEEQERIECYAQKVHENEVVSREIVVQKADAEDANHVTIRPVGCEME